jgi:BCD family chlorophyll transporter-like MFS transporter
MMALAGEGRTAREGTRMGLWGAAQAIAAGFGGLIGTALVDLARPVMGDADGFAAVFLFEATLYIASALMAARVIARPAQPRLSTPLSVPGE